MLLLREKEEHRGVRRKTLKAVQAHSHETQTPGFFGERHNELAARVIRASSQFVNTLYTYAFVVCILDPWPSGSYSLPKPMSGCPKLWEEGWLKQNLEDDAKEKSQFSSNFHMNASISSMNNKEFLERTFCTKVTHTTIWNIPWPKG